MTSGTVSQASAQDRTDGAPVALSALVVARNEEEALPACLAALGFADEIVVVLDRCTDDSEAVARRYTGRVLAGGWPIEGDRRNAGIDACRGAWIVEVDADEIVSPALAAEIRHVIATSSSDWHSVAIDNYVGDRHVRNGWGAYFGVGSKNILFRKGAKRWGAQRVHPSLDWTGTGGPRLSATLTHRVDRDIFDMVDRLNRYTSERAADMRAEGINETLGRNLRRFVSRFYKVYIRRKGYREGEWGFLLALMTALYPLLSYLKARLEDGKTGR